MLNSAKSCTLQGCMADKAFALINPKTNKIHRISFSSTLLQHIVDTHEEYNHLVVKEITFTLGKELQRGETSSTGMYAIVKSKNNWTLRISLMKNVANYICDFDTRKLRECIVTKVH